MLLSANIAGYIIVIGTAVFFLLLVFLYLFFIQYSKKRVEHIKEIKEMQAAYEQTLLQTQLEIQEQTLNYISQEIHDNVGQVLSLVKLRLSTLFINGAPIEDNIAETKELISKAINDLRGISKSLNSERIREIGIVAAIEHDLQQLERTKQFTTSLTDDADLHYLSIDKIVILYRTVQEILNNIIKHSGGNHVSVNITKLGKNDIITISDNGKGFIKGEKIETGLGLKNITKRATTIGAIAKVDSKINEGTTISIILPESTPNA